MKMYTPTHQSTESPMHQRTKTPTHHGANAPTHQPENRMTITLPESTYLAVHMEAGRLHTSKKSVVTAAMQLAIEKREEVIQTFNEIKNDIDKMLDFCRSKELLFEEDEEDLILEIDE